MRERSGQVAGSLPLVVLPTPPPQQHQGDWGCEIVELG